MAEAFGIVTSSPEHKVEGMQDYRPIGAFSFLGRFRVIDFPISNFSNSGSNNIQVYISSKPRSLVAHIGTGRHYNINSKRGRIQIIVPNEDMVNPIYNTNINAFFSNIDYIRRQSREYVVIAPSCMVFAQNYDELLQDHVKSGADITLLYHKVFDAKEGYTTCNALSLDGDKVTGISRNLGDEDTKDIFMESFVMKKDLLIDLMYAARETSSVYTLANIVNAKCGELNVRAVEHHGFFAPITSLKTYHKANLDLIDVDESASLFSTDWPIYTRTSDSCPTQFYDEADVKNSLVSNGCEVKGSVEDSVIGRGVKIGKGSSVKGCIVMAYAEIGENVVLQNQVVDKYAKIIHENKILAEADTPGYIKHSDVL
jgi:glucose-1-phosphate adenylyltransferase